MFRWLVEQRLMVRKAAAMSFQPASHSMRQPYATHVRVRLEVCGKTDFL